ncbi:MAG TPA: hypothetical protein VHI52_15640 [Verrucomicrobiae bacterium]|nr:hypothetical protein [Verrucomicrobiae bacterium]
MFCLSAKAQQAPSEQMKQQQAANEASMAQQRAYQQAMTDCMATAFPPPGTQAGRPVDPNVYLMTDDKMQTVIKCMDGKGIAPPVWSPPGAGKFVQEYEKKNSANSRQIMVNQANLMAAMWKREAETVAGSNQQSASASGPSGDAADGRAADPGASTAEPPPKIYITPQASGNASHGSGQKPLWVVPQSQ